MTTDYRQFSLWIVEPSGRLRLWVKSDDDMRLLRYAEDAWVRGVKGTLCDREGQVIWQDGRALLWHDETILRPADLIAMEEFRP